MELGTWAQDSLFQAPRGVSDDQGLHLSSDLLGQMGSSSSDIHGAACPICGTTLKNGDFWQGPFPLEPQAFRNKMSLNVYGLIRRVIEGIRGLQRSKSFFFLNYMLDKWELTAYSMIITYLYFNQHSFTFIQYLIKKKTRNTAHVQLQPCSSWLCIWTTAGWHQLCQQAVL